jgi:DNA-binding MarR family transcriptional regulator
MVRRIQGGLRGLTQQLGRLNGVVGSRVELLPGDMAVLDLVDRLGPMSPRALSDATGIHPATLTGILDRLEHGGWMRRLPDPTDRRRVSLETLPDRGGELVRLYAPMNKALAKLCSGYTPDELAAIADFLERAAAAGEAATTEVRSVE